MANPNIVNVTAIYGKTASAALGTGSADIVTNASASGTVVKINSIIVANVDGTNNADVQVGFSDAGTVRKLAHNVTVPAGATLVVLGKNEAIYLEENDKITALASAAGDLEIVVSYEIIS